jgi:hypothetical protein
MRFIKVSILVVAISLLTACGGPFVRLDKPAYANTSQGYTANLPVGWVQATGPQNADSLWISRDGFSLQSIKIEALKHDKAFESQKKPANLTMPISDLAELEIAEIKAKNPNAASLKVLENTLTNVGNQKAFRIHYQFLNDKGLRFEQITYGLINVKNYYKITYMAPSLHYFARDKALFDQTVASFRLTS